MGNEIDKFHCRKSARLFHKQCGFAAIFGKGYMANKKERYKDFFETDEAKTVLHFFDSKFPIYAPSISSVKKIDFLIYWKGKFGIN